MNFLSIVHSLALCVRDDQERGRRRRKRRRRQCSCCEYIVNTHASVHDLITRGPSLAVPRAIVVPENVVRSLSILEYFPAAYVAHQALLGCIVGFLCRCAYVCIRMYMCVRVCTYACRAGRTTYIRACVSGCGQEARVKRQHVRNQQATQNALMQPTRTYKELSELGGRLNLVLASRVIVHVLDARDLFTYMLWYI